MKPDLSVLIPTHQRRDSLRRTIESLRQQTYPADNFEIVVGVDRCTDGTLELLSDAGISQLRYVESANPGAGAARNAALRAAGGDVCVFMDDDLEAAPGFLAAHAAAHARARPRDVVVVGYAPVHMNADSSPFVRSLAAGFDRYFLSMRRGGEEPVDQGLLGGNFSARTELVRRVGGFDESLSFREDVDLGIRLRRAGAALRFAEEARADQHVELSLAQMISRAEPRAEADMFLLDRYPGEARLLELYRSMIDARARRRFRILWHVGGLIDLGAGAAQLVRPGSLRLGSYAIPGEICAHRAANCERLGQPGREASSVVERVIGHARAASPRLIIILHAHAGGRAHRLLARHCFGLRVIRHLHGIEEPWVASVRVGDARARRYFERTFAASHRALVCSEWFASRVRAAAPAQGNDVSAFRHGVDLGRLQPASPDAQVRETLGISAASPVVGFVGRMVRQKGIPALLEIAAELAHARPDVVLVVVGDGPLLDWARTRAAELSLRNVRFAGAHADVVPFMHLFDVLAVTSAWEPFGIVSIEAMAAGVPVVAFDIDGVGEAVTDGVTGFLVPPHDTLAFSARVVELCDDGVMRRTIGEAGRIHAAQRFDARAMASEMEKIYAELSGRPSAPRRSTR